MSEQKPKNRSHRIILILSVTPILNDRKLYHFFIMIAGGQLSFYMCNIHTAGNGETIIIQQIPSLEWLRTVFLYGSYQMSSYGIDPDRCILR